MIFTFSRNKLSHDYWEIILLGILLFFYFPIVATIGFISDDWELIKISSHKTLWEPLEPHHYSLFINLLFKGAVVGVVTPVVIHFVVLSFHFVNTLLVFRIARDEFCSLSNFPTPTSFYKDPAFQAFLVALFFLINFAGLEALMWCCAAGYVLCATWILCGFQLFIREIQNHSGHSLKTAFFLFLFQVLAFLSWDWGVLFTPLLGVIALVMSPLNFHSFQHRLRLLLPAIGCWFLVLGFKQFMGQDLGYQLNSPLRMAQIMMVSPLLTLLPVFSKAFYTSFVGSLLVILTWGGICWGLWQKPKARIPLCLFILCFVPIILLGSPQSRYFYLPSFFLACALLLMVSGEDKYRIKRSLFVLLLGIHAVGAWDKRGDWQRADAFANSLKSEISSRLKEENRPLVVVNLPDRYGTDGGVWLPFMWRNGLCSFPNTFDCIYTPDCPNLFQTAHSQIVSRDEVLNKFYEHAIYEVIPVKEEGYWTYHLVPFMAVSNESSSKGS